MLKTNIDPKKVEAYAGNILNILNHGALSLMISVGHRAKIFDHMADMPPATSEEIAKKCRLNERYVREWLGAMLMGGVVDYDAATKKYSLPPEHASVLTRDGSPMNMAAFAQFIPLLGKVEDEIVECFEKGGGLPYSAYPRFQEVMAEDSGQMVLPALFDVILPLVPGIEKKLEKGIEVLDLACGCGRALNKMAQRYPNSHFVGYDFSKEGIEKATKEACDLGLANVEFKVKDVTNLGETEKYDLITVFDAIHDQVKPQQVLNGIYQALKPGGDYLMQDIQACSSLEKNKDHPMGTLLYTVSCMHCMSVSLSEHGEGLGTMWGHEKATEMLKKAGFEDVTLHQLPHDPQNSYYVMKKK